ncbi:MAG: porin [Verrucomicrobiota bacterium]|nr:porin [Verrucomicrobiota bacterium]
MRIFPCRRTRRSRAAPLHGRRGGSVPCKRRSWTPRLIAAIGCLGREAGRSSIGVAGALLFSATLARGTESGFDWFKPFSSLTGEYSAEETYVSDADVRRGQRRIDSFDESDTILHFVLTPRIKLGVLRFGVEWERFSFGFPDRTPLPNTLQEISAIIGLDMQISDSILMRVEAQPGFYGTNNFDTDQINVPFIAGGTYIYNPSLQFIVGVSIDVEREYPVIPAAGIRWKIARQWVLNAVLPQPRIEFEAAKNVTLYVGGNIKQTSFRVDDDFGNTHGNPQLNRAVVSYSEARAGVGVDWKLGSIVTLSAEAGYQPYRSFDFFRADIRYHEDGSAPYGMISLHGAF